MANFGTQREQAYALFLAPPGIVGDGIASDMIDISR